MGDGTALRRLAAVAIVAVVLAGCAGTGGGGGAAGDEGAQYMLFLRATEGAAPNGQVTLPPAAQWPDVLKRCRAGVPALLKQADELQKLQARLAAASAGPVSADAETVTAALYWALALSEYGEGGMTSGERASVFAFLRALPSSGPVSLPSGGHGAVIRRAVGAGCAIVAGGTGKMQDLIDRLTGSPEEAQAVPAALAALLGAAYTYGGGAEAGVKAAESTVDMEGMAACIRRLSAAGAVRPFTAGAPGKMAVLTWRLPKETTEHGQRVLTQRDLQYFPNVDDQTLYYELTLRKVGDGQWEFVSGTQVKDGERTAVQQVGAAQ